MADREKYEEFIAPVQINVKSFSLHEFWWSHYGFRPRYEDELQIQSDDGKVDYGASIFMKGYIREALRDESGFKKGSEESMQYWFSKSLDYLLQEDRILFSRQHTPTPIVLKEISPSWLNGEKITIPTNFNFAIYHPAEYETYETIEEAVRRFVREYSGIPFSEIHLVNEKLSEDEAQRAYEEWRLKDERSRGNKNNELRFDLEFLALLVGKEEINRYPDIVFGLFGEGDCLYAELKDGSRHPIGRPRLKVLGGDK